MGEAFFVHARGLYHQRCSPLDAQHTRWHRGDAHATYRGGFAPDDADYDDHAAAGWGFRDAAGAFHSFGRIFEVVEATATDEALPEVTGGWHDAGDYDRRPSHLMVVNDLAHAYLMSPATFAGGQLNLPESGNGIPDIVDEARWGVEV